eukprot:TRINITY_DN13609_c0_g1_i1.p1 TRINITY_DN13609_c0_g1~~TRINITY_DN13609_c0_g1_i1.p1  ORF type:complete len:1433 (-),score=246.70 TRINITY_DN13609_c0_g1_i1:56-4168(-)
MLERSGKRAGMSGRDATLLCATVLLLALVLPHSLSSAASEGVFHVTISVPDTQLGQVEVNVSNGVVSLQEVSVRTLALDLCMQSTAAASSVTLRNLSVASELRVCSHDYVGVEDLALATTASAHLECDRGLVELSLLSALRGSYEVIAPAGEASIDASGCSLATSPPAQSGQCESGESFVRIVADRVVATLSSRALEHEPSEDDIVGEQHGDPCEVNNGPYVPSSSSVASSWTNPGRLHDLSNTELWWPVNEWGQSETTEADGEILVVHEWSDNAQGDMVLRDRAWGPQVVYIVLREGVLDEGLNKGEEYVFTFNVRHGDGNFYYLDLGDDSWPELAVGEPGADVRMDFVVASDLEEESKWRWLEKAFSGEGCGAQCEVIHREMFHNGPIDTAFRATDWVLPLGEISVNYPQAALFVRMELPGRPGRHDEEPGIQGNEYLFKNVALERLSRAREFGSVVTKSAELVDVPKPKVVVDAERTECPHLQSDLVRWSEPDLWNGAAPAPDGRDVTLPENTKVLLLGCDLQPGRYGTIIVPASSELIIGDAPLAWVVDNIFVEGALRAGSPTCRLNSKVSITFHSEAGTMPSPHVGRKGLAVVKGGEVDIHGKLFHHTWSRLASSVSIGDDRILLQDDVNWEVGQQVVIATSVWDDWSSDENEVMSIKAIEGRRVQFTEPVRFFHYAGPEYQVEVALLSRHILLQGDEASEESSIGGHVIVHEATGRFSGVLLRRMGQKNVLARYPLHFHMMGDAPESFMQDSAVWHSYYRCFVIHGTHNTRVSRNVAFDATGHCFYIEDGVEEGSLLEHNAAIHVNPITAEPGVPTDFFASGFGQDGITVRSTPHLLIPADIAPAGFYITNTNNEFVGNAASGGFTGFSFPNLPHPIGSHRDASVIPMERPLKRFYGNSAHSAGPFWSRNACMYVGGQLWYEDSDSDDLTYNVGRLSRNTMNDDGSPHWMLFEHTRVFLCQRGINHWGDRLDVQYYEAHDTTRAATLFGESSIQHAILNMDSGNPVTFPAAQAFQFYDIFVKTILLDVDFRNIKEFIGENPHKSNAAFISLTHSDLFKPQGISATKRISYTNVDSGTEILHYQRATGASRQYNFMDWDGSATHFPFGAGQPVVVGAADSELYDPEDSASDVIEEWWRFHDDCILREDWKVWLCPKPRDVEVANVRLERSGLVYEDEQNPVTLGTVSHFGYSGDERRAIVFTNNPGVTGVTGDTGMYLYLERGSPDSFDLHPAQVPRTDEAFTYVVWAMRYPAAARFSVQAVNLYNPNADVINIALAGSVSEMMADESCRKYAFVTDGSEGWVYFKLRNFLLEEDGPNVRWFERDGVRIYDVMNAFKYEVRVTSCSGCQESNGYYRVTDKVPPKL